MITRTIGHKKWYCNDLMASELELFEFMYGFVRLLKPDVAVETGSHIGLGSEAIGKALQRNGHGHLYTCDIDEHNVLAAKKQTEHFPVTVTLEDAMELVKRIRNVEFAFIDSGTNRAAEAKALNLAPHAYVLLHDAHQKEYPGFDDIKEATGWTAMKLPTPVGLGIFEVRT